MKNYLSPLQTALTNLSLPIIGIPVNFLEKDISFSDSNISTDLDASSKFLHHKHGFRRFISDVKVDVSPSIYFQDTYDRNLDYSEIYYTFTEDLLKAFKLIKKEDSIKNFDPPFFSDRYQKRELTNFTTMDCRFFLNKDSYGSFIERCDNELNGKNYINIPGISNKTNVQNILKPFLTTVIEPPWKGPKTNTNPSVKYVMKEEYQEKSITYLLLLAIYNYINNIALPDYVQIISECEFKTPEKQSSDPWWLDSPNNFLNNFQKSSNSLYSDMIQGFGYDIFEDYKTNNSLVPKNFRTVFFLRIPYDSIQTIDNYDVNILNNEIINMNPSKPPTSNLTKEINYLR